MKIKVNGRIVPESYKDIDYNFYEKLQEKTAIEVLFDKPFDQIIIDKIVFIEILNRLSFLKDNPIFNLSQKDKTDIYSKTIEHKLIAQNIIKKNENKIEMSFPYLCALYEIEFYNESEAMRETEKYFKLPFDFVFTKGLYIFEQISINNESMLNELEKFKVKKTDEEVLAGYDEKLKDYFDFSLIDKLANGDILKHTEAKHKKLKEVNTWLIYNQRLSYCRYIESEARRRNLKQKKYGKH